MICVWEMAGSLSDTKLCCGVTYPGSNSKCLCTKFVGSGHKGLDVAVMCNVCCCHSIFLMKRCSLVEKERKMIMSLLTIPGTYQQPRN